MSMTPVTNVITTNRGLFDSTSTNGGGNTPFISSPYAPGTYTESYCIQSTPQFFPGGYRIYVSSDHPVSFSVATYVGPTIISKSSPIGGCGSGNVLDVFVPYSGECGIMLIMTVPAGSKPVTVTAAIMLAKNAF